jgi:hypothetical protein
MVQQIKLPESVDLRKEFTPPVEDQGDLNASSVFAVLTALETLEKLNLSRFL